MKKVLSFILILAFCLLLIACGNDDNNDGNNETGDLTMKITVGNIEFIAKLYDNETAKAIAEMLPMTLDMSAMAHEKYYYLPNNLPTAAYSPQTIQEGDIMLWGSNCFVLFYETFSTSYSYTKIGKIENTVGLAAALGRGSVTVKFELTEDGISDEPENTDDVLESEVPNEPQESSEPIEPEIPKEPIEPIEPIKPDEPSNPTEPETPIENEVTKMLITVNGISFKAELYNNDTAKALADMLPITISMNELNNNEKYYYLPNNLPAAATNAGTIQAGDIMLYGSNCLVLFYKSFSTSYSYTKIGRIEDTTGLIAALGSGSVTVTFSIN